MPLVGRHQLRSTSHLSDLEEDSGTIVQKGIEVVAVTAETDRQRVAKYIHDHALTFPVVTSQEFFKELNVTATPRKVLLSPDMRIIHVWSGATTQDAWSGDITMMTALLDIHKEVLPLSPSSN